ncbi:hypothetical protein D9M72_529180 [compost metagenome]
MLLDHEPVPVICVVGHEVRRQAQPGSPHRHVEGAPARVLLGWPCLGGAGLGWPRLGGAGAVRIVDDIDEGFANDGDHGQRPG